MYCAKCICYTDFCVNELNEYGLYHILNSSTYNDKPILVESITYYSSYIYDILIVGAQL